MKSFARLFLPCLALVLLAPFAAFAADATESPATAPVEQPATPVALDEVPMTPADSTAAADPLSLWMELPEWASDQAVTTYGFCPGPPVLSCQCGPSLQFPRAEPCCYCDTCWDGYVLALCGDLEF